VDVLQVGNVEGAKAINWCAQGGFGVDRGDAFARLVKGSPKLQNMSTGT
jgi:hypothetical protein